MKTSNITLGKDVAIDSSSTFNNVTIHDNVRIAKNCNIYGSNEHILEIGKESYVGMHSLLNGYASKLIIGKNVSIAQNVNIMTDSGPNASKEMQEYFRGVFAKIEIEVAQVALKAELDRRGF